MNDRPRISRRDFIKRIGIGAAAGVGGWLLADRTRPAAASTAGAGPTWGMLIDLTRCAGCNACALACKEANGLPNPDRVPAALDAHTYTFVESVQLSTAEGEILTRHVKRQCMHCLDAACVAACPAAAMYNSGQGPVVYRSARCLGCRYCEAGCPFGIPRFDWESSITATINKCWLCYDRLPDGRPACVDACPTGALRFGERAELLAQAHGQIATHPKRYVDHVFGEHEVGGTSILYLADVPFEQLGFPADLPLTPPPAETEKIMSVLPFVLGGMATLMSGTAAFTHRRQKGDDHGSA